MFGPSGWSLSSRDLCVPHYLCAVSGLQKTHPHGAFFGGLNSGPHACMPHSLQNEPLLHSNRCTEKRPTSSLWAWVMTSSQPPALMLKRWRLWDNPGLKDTCAPKLATLHVSCQDLKMCWLVCRSCILDSYGFSKPYIVCKNPERVSFEYSYLAQHSRSIYGITIKELIYLWKLHPVNRQRGHTCLSPGYPGCP